MPLWILDTDHVSLLQRGNTVVLSKVALINSNEIAVTVITKQLLSKCTVV